MAVMKERADLPLCNRPDVSPAGGPQCFHTQLQETDGPGHSAPGPALSPGWSAHDDAAVSSLAPGFRTPSFRVSSIHGPRILLFPGSLQLGTVALHLLSLGHNGKHQSHSYSTSGAECVTFPSAERACQSSSDPTRLGQVGDSHVPGLAGGNGPSGTAEWVQESGDGSVCVSLF